MMELDDEDILRTVASGGSMDYSAWPDILPKVVSRIEKIAHEAFPIPQLPAAAPVGVPSSQPAPTADSEDTDNFLAPLPSSPTNPPSTTSSQETNKENTPVAPRATRPPTSVQVSATLLPPGTLPPQAAALLKEITTTLTSTFPTYPPHTVQRLAELVLTPKRHYKSLPTYLHALDRVVHVTSGLNVYPLPPAVPDMSTISLLSNGVSDSTTPSPWATPGSDEALGGALLTPIPWLQHGGSGNSQAQQGLSPRSESQTSSTSGDSTSDRHNGGSGSGSSGDTEAALRTESTETIDGPNGMGSIETVTVTMNGVPSMGARGVGVTQGELLRQEQQAGVVPVSQLVPNHHHPIHSAHRVAAAAAAAAAATSSSSPSTAATEGSASERNSSIYAAAEQAIESGEAVGSVSGADEEEKPHARGPDEIGPADIGSQREGTASTHYVGGGPGVEMQGINLEAAVGRKANEKHTSASPDPPKKADDDAVEKEVEDGGAGGGDDDDKMEGVEVTTRARSSTPKREADEGLEGVAKKLKEDGDAADAPKRADGDTDDAGTEIPVSDAKAGEDSAGSD